MNARVTLYKLHSGAGERMVRKAEIGMSPIFQKQPGFRSYQLIRTGTDSLISISFWDTEAHADAAVKVAKAWVAENAGEDVIASETHVGPIVLSHSK